MGIGSLRVLLGYALSLWYTGAAVGWRVCDVLMKVAVLILTDAMLKIGSTFKRGVQVGRVAGP